jgi:hypothetical protein
MKELTLQEMFKKFKGCSDDKSDNSGSHSSTSSTFHVIKC